MLRMTGRRLAVVIPMMWAIATVAFFLVHLIPGDPGRSILGDSATLAQVKALDHQLGYDRPLLVQYGRWLDDVVHGDFGSSVQTHLPATQVVGERIPITLSIVVGSIVLTLVFGVLLGVVSAVRGGRTDRAVQAGVGLAMAIPSFWLGVLLVLLFSIVLGWLPAVGYVPLATSFTGWLTSVTLPCVAVALTGIAAIARQTRGSMLDVLGRDYMRTLRATGVSRTSLIFKHGLRNASIPIITNLGFQFIVLLGGTVIIEQVFAIQGIGALTLSSVTQKDFPVLLTVVLYTTALVLVVNLLTDLGAAWLNPKVRRL